MRRVMVFGFTGLLLLGLAGMDLAARAASMLVNDVKLASLDSTDHPDPVVSGDPEDPSQPVPPPTRQDVLLVGLDSREGMTKEQMNEMGANDHGGSLTDTIIWVQWLPDEQDLRMVSIPRDLRVEDPIYGVEKINALHSLYDEDGRDRLVSEVEDLVGADLNHYVEINLAGFVKLTDAIGGVEICPTESFDDEKVGYFSAGCQVLDGIDAGRYTRARHVSDQFGSGAYARNRRQQYFIKQAIEQTLSADTLANPVKLRRLAAVASDVATVDDGLSLQGIYDLANVFRTTEPDEITGLSLPVDGGFFDNGAWYDVPNEAAEDVFAALRNGTEMPRVDDEGNVVTDDVLAGSNSQVVGSNSQAGAGDSQG